MPAFIDFLKRLWLRRRKPILAVGAVLLALFLLPRLVAECYYFMIVVGEEEDVYYFERLERMGHSGAVPPLVRLLKNEDSLTREFAAEVLHHYRGKRAVKALMEAAREDLDERVRAAAISSLGKIGDPMALPLLKELGWKDGRAVWVLPSMGEGGKEALLEYFRKHPKPDRRAYALEVACGRPSWPSHFKGDPQMGTAIREAVGDAAWEVRAAGAHCAGEFLGGEGAGALKALLSDPKPEVRIMASRQLGKLKDTSGVPVLRAIVMDRSLPSEVRGEAVLAFGDVGDQGVFPLLRDLAREDSDVSAYARNALGRLFGPGDPRAYGRERHE